MPRRHDPRGAMHAEPVVALLADIGLTRVQGPAHAHLGSVGPGVGLEEPALCGCSGQRRVSRLTERDEERIALSVDLLPVVLGERRAEDASVICENVSRG